MYVRHTFGMQLNFHSWVSTNFGNLLTDFDRRPKEALVVLKVPWVYTESDDVGKAWERGYETGDVGKAWERGYETGGDFRWATNTGSLVKDINSRHKLPLS